MFQLSFKTPSGSEAHLTGTANIDIPETVFGKVTPDDAPDSANAIKNIKLYRLSTTPGNWEETSDITDGFRRRRKRNQAMYTVSIAGLTLGKHWYNFDAVSDTTCYSKVRVFEDQEFKESDQHTSVTVFAMVKDDLETYSFSTRLANNNNNENGYCIVHRCDKPGNSNNGFEGYLVVQKDGKNLIPAVNDTTVSDLEEAINYNAESNRLAVKFDLTKASDGQGPFYDWNGKWVNSESCINADFSHKHFRFHLHPEDQCDILNGVSIEKEPDSMCEHSYYLSWYSVTETLEEEFTSCYARVKIAHYTNRIRVQAISKVGTMKIMGNNIGDIIKPGDTYGSHEGCSQGGVVCIRIKPHGRRSCSRVPPHVQIDEHTKLDITARYKYSGIYLNVSNINPELMENNDVTSNDTRFSLNWVYAANSDELGIFCSTNNLMEESKITAEQNCMNADDSLFAVQFGGKTIP